MQVLNNLDNSTVVLIFLFSLSRLSLSLFLSTWNGGGTVSLTLISRRSLCIRAFSHLGVFICPIRTAFRANEERHMTAFC